MSKWRVFLVPKAAPIVSPRLPVLTEWADLAEREESTGIRPGDPILLAPDYRVDELLGLYTRSSPEPGPAGLLDHLGGQDLRRLQVAGRLAPVRAAPR